MMQLDNIEPLAKLGIDWVGSDDNGTRFRIPLHGNRNDKGTVFAGSQYLSRDRIMMAMRCGDIHHINHRIVNQCLITAVQQACAILVGKGLTTFSISASHRVKLTLR